ncbi:MAG: FAD-dependent oxidoreductase [Planctomycetia bacterium]
MSNSLPHASDSTGRPHVVVVGGGLAGLSAAAALTAAGVRVTVLEARRRAGGRAASFEDPVAGGLVDACQHVAMGCCTNFLDLCRQAGLADALRRDRTLWFSAPMATAPPARLRACCRRHCTSRRCSWACGISRSAKSCRSGSAC